MNYGVLVGSKQNKQWIWLALDVTTRQVIACYVGGRTKDDARRFWELIPKEYKNESDFFTDMFDAYQGIIPEDCLYQVKKKRTYKSHRASKLYVKATRKPIGQKILVVFQKNRKSYRCD